MCIRDRSPLTRAQLEGDAQRGWFSGPVVLRPQAEDRSMGVLSGVQGTWLRPLGGLWQPWDGPEALDQEGIHAFEYRSADHAGNAEPVRDLVVRLDWTPPVTVVSVDGEPAPDGWYRGPLGLRFEATDAASGVGQVWVRANEGTWMETAQVDIVVTGEHLFEYYAVDRAGNQEAVRSLELKVDVNPPSAAAALPVLAGMAPFRLDVRAEDVGSGVRRVAFYVGHEVVPRHVDHDGSDGWSWVLEEPGVHRLRLQAVDGVGFEGWGEVHVLVLPRVPPLPLLLLPLGLGLSLGLRLAPRGRP